MTRLIVKFWCTLDAILRRLYRLCGYMAAFFLVMIAVLVCASIISRLFSVYVPGLTEYSGYCMAAASFLGLAYTFEHRAHIRVDLFISRLQGKKRFVAELWTLLAATVICIYLAFYLGRLVYFSWVFEEKSEGADAILMWMPQSFVFVGGVVLAICVTHALIRTCITRRIGDQA